MQSQPNYYLMVQGQHLFDQIKTGLNGAVLSCYLVTVQYLVHKHMSPNLCTLCFLHTKVLRICYSEQKTYYSQDLM